MYRLADSSMFPFNVLGTSKAEGLPAQVSSYCVSLGAKLKRGFSAAHKSVAAPLLLACHGKEIKRAEPE